MTFRKLFQLLKDTSHEWLEDNAPRLGTALAYYSIFSIGPLLVMAIAISGLIFGRAAAEGRVFDEIKGNVGDPVAHALQQIIADANNQSWTSGSAILGFGIFLFGAIGVFVGLQDALNSIWKVKPKPGRGFLMIVKDRFFSFTMVLATGLIILSLLIVATVLFTLSNSLSIYLPGDAHLWQLINLLASFLIFTVLFAMIYKILPDAQVAWRDVWIGSAITALLFTIGKYFLAWYLGRSSVTSAYGAAGSLVVILLWVHYSSYVLLFGAEFTRVYAEQFGSGIHPASNAVLL